MDVTAHELVGVGEHPLALGTVRRLVQERRRLGSQIGHRHMQCLHRSHLAFVADDAHRLDGQLRGVRVALQLYGAAHLPFGPRQVAAEAYEALAHHERWQAIAVLSGAAPPRSIFAHEARAAKRQVARQQPGTLGTIPPLRELSP